MSTQFKTDYLKQVTCFKSFGRQLVVLNCPLIIYHGIMGKLSLFQTVENPG